MTASERSRFVRPLVISVVLAVAMYAALMMVGEIRQVSDALGRLDFVGWCAVLGLSLFNYLLRFARWHIYLAELDARIPLWRHFVIYIAGFGLATTPGKAGEAIRCVYLGEHAVKYSASLAALFVERLMDLGVMMMLAVAAAWYLPSARLPVVGAATITLILLSLLSHPAPQRLLQNFVQHVRSSRVRDALHNVASLVRASTVLLTPKLLYPGLGIGMLAWGAEGLGLWVILAHLHSDISIPLAVGIYAVGILAGALSLIPGGLGSAEAVMVLLLSSVGVDLPIALAATLLCRIATLWFAVVLGLASLAGLTLGRRRSRQPAGSGVSHG